MREKKSSSIVSLSEGDTDIFEEVIESICCADILYNCFQILEKKLGEICDLFSSTKEVQLDRQKQCSSRTCLLIHCVKENEKENPDEVFIEIFEKEMQEKVSFNDINRSHRSRKIHAGSRPWSINNNFARRNARNAVLEKKS